MGDDDDDSDDDIDPSLAEFVPRCEAKEVSAFRPRQRGCRPIGPTTLASVTRRETLTGAPRARGVVEATELGRMAMAVLDGGLFAGARLMDLAEAIVGEAPTVPEHRRARS